MNGVHYDKDGFRLSFEKDTDTDEKEYFLRAFPNVSKIAERKIHCTSCQTHIGTAPVSEAIIRMHPVLRVTHCRSCNVFYSSGEFDKGEDGSELYCRWCGQGGEVYCCSNCPYVFCKSCILKNLSRSCVQDIARNENWSCFACAPKIMWHLRAQHWALMNFIEKQKKDIKMQHSLEASSINNLLKQDLTTCCTGKGAHRKGNQALATSSGKKISKPTEEQEEADNVPLAKMKNESIGRSTGSGDIHITKDKLLKPMVSIPPMSSSILDMEKASTSTSTPTLKQTDGKQKKLKHKHPGTPLDAQEQPHSPSQKKAKTGHNEVVCTPDIIGMFNQMDESSTPRATGPLPNVAPGVLVAGSPHNKPGSHITSGGFTISTATPQLQTAATFSSIPQKPKAILHKSLPRNLTVRMAPVEATSTTANSQVNQVAEPPTQTVRVSPMSLNRNNPPVYHTINGYRIDLHSAAQQGTYRLPNGKLIQVRKQISDAPSVASAVVKDASFSFGSIDTTVPLQPHQMTNAHSVEQQPNRMNIAPNAPQIQESTTCSPLFQQQQSNAMMTSAAQQVLTYLPQRQTQLHQQAIQPAQQQSLHQQQQHQQLQQQQQLQRQPGQQHQIHQRPRGRLSQSLRTKQQKLSVNVQRSVQRQQPYQRVVPHPQQPRPVNATVTSGGQFPMRVVAQQQNQTVVNMQQTPSPAPTGNQQLPILQMLRGLVAAPHEESALGSARKDFEEKLLGCVEACNHIIIKIHTLTQSNSFKTIRNLRDLKELFIHVSYLMSYGIGRFKSLHDRCVDDVHKMGFTKPSDFVMMGEKVSNRNPEDSEDDDDCEIIEQNTTVIQVDSDDDGTSEKGEIESSDLTQNQKPSQHAAIPLQIRSHSADATLSDLDSQNDTASDCLPSVVDTSVLASLPVTNTPETFCSAEEATQANTMEPESQVVDAAKNSVSVQRNESTTTRLDDMLELVEIDESNSVAVSENIRDDSYEEPTSEKMASTDVSTTVAASNTSGNCTNVVKDQVEIIEMSPSEVSELLDIDESYETSQFVSKSTVSQQPDKSVAGPSSQPSSETINVKEGSFKNVKAASSAVTGEEAAEPMKILESDEHDQDKSDQLSLVDNYEKESVDCSQQKETCSGTVTIESSKHEDVIELMELSDSEEEKQTISDPVSSKANFPKVKMECAKREAKTESEDLSDLHEGKRHKSDQTPVDSSSNETTAQDKTQKELAEPLEFSKLGSPRTGERIEESGSVRPLPEVNVNKETATTSTSKQELCNKSGSNPPEAGSKTRTTMTDGSITLLEVETEATNVLQSKEGIMNAVNKTFSDDGEKTQSTDRDDLMQKLDSPSNPSFEKGTNLNAFVSTSDALESAETCKIEKRNNGAYNDDKQIPQYSGKGQTKNDGFHSTNPFETCVESAASIHSVDVAADGKQTSESMDVEENTPDNGSKAKFTETISDSVNTTSFGSMRNTMDSNVGGDSTNFSQSDTAEVSCVSLDGSSVDKSSRNDEKKTNETDCLDPADSRGETESKDKNSAVVSNAPVVNTLNIASEEAAKKSEEEGRCYEKTTEDDIIDEEKVADISEEQANVKDSEKDMSVDGEEQFAKDDESDREVVNLMELSNDTDSNESYSEVETPQLVLDEEEGEQSMNSSMALKNATSEIILDDVSSDSSCFSKDEYTDAVAEVMKESSLEKSRRSSTDVTPIAKAISVDAAAFSVVGSNDIELAGRSQGNPTNTSERPSENPTTTERNPGGRTSVDPQREP